MTRDATASRIFDALLSSPTTPALSRRHFLQSLLSHYHTLADDRIGSRVAERCWAVADVYLKDKIASSLVEQQLFLQASAFGHFLARKLELPLWSRKREEWKLKMAGGARLEEEAARKKAAKKLRRAGRHLTEEGMEKARKRRERPVDEIDELFARGGLVQPKRAKLTEQSDEDEEEQENEEEQIIEKRKKKKAEALSREPGLEAIFSALQQ
jgi:nucleolar protein 9